jgi:anti-sigma factor RsiW
MSTCQYREQLSPYFDGELSAEASQALEQHLSTCPACVAELAQLRKLSAVIGRWKAPTLSPEATKALHRSIDVTSFRRLERLAMGLSAVAACLVVATLLTSHNTPSPALLAPWESAAMAATDELPAGNTQEVAVAQWVVADLSNGGAERE